MWYLHLSQNHFFNICKNIQQKNQTKIPFFGGCLIMSNWQGSWSVTFLIWYKQLWHSFVRNLCDEDVDDLNQRSGSVVPHTFLKYDRNNHSSYSANSLSRNMSLAVFFTCCRWLARESTFQAGFQVFEIPLGKKIASLYFQWSYTTAKVNKSVALSLSFSCKTAVSLPVLCLCSSQKAYVPKQFFSFFLSFSLKHFELCKGSIHVALVGCLFEQYGGDSHRLSSTPEQCCPVWGCRQAR